MNKEVKSYSLYSYLIKISSLLKVAKILNKEETINEIEKLVEEMLNFYENVNFDKPNFFYKDYIPTPSTRIVLLIKKEDDLLFIKEDESYKTLNFLSSLDKSIDIDIKTYLNKLNLNLIDYELKMIKFREPLTNKNNNYSNYENLLIFEVKIDKIIDSEKLSFLFINSLKELSKKDELNINELNEILKELKDNKDKVIIK